MDLESRKRLIARVLPFISAFISAAGAAGGGWTSWEGPPTEKLLFASAAALVVGLFSYFLMKWMIKITGAL